MPLLPSFGAPLVLGLFCHFIFYQTVIVMISAQIEENNIKRTFLKIIPMKFQYYKEKTPVSQVYAARIRLTSNIDYKAIPTTAAGSTGRDAKIHMTVPQLITSAGYGYELHEVNTTDGYILGVFRVFRRDCRENPSHRPVLLQHGFLGSAADWFLQEPDRALPFFLVDNGYDVWLGNARDHILDTVQKEGSDHTAIKYVGHGMGTTMVYVCLAEYPCLYNKKIESLVSLAPQALLYRTQAVFPRKLAKFFKLQKYFGTAGKLTSSDLSALSHLVAPELCLKRIAPGLSMCDAFYYLFTGVDFPTKNVTMMRRVLGHIPSPTSLKTLLHILQHVDSPQFRQFDYGEVKNFVGYGQTTPPKYNLFQINVQSVNIYALEDELLNPLDSYQSVQELGTSQSKFNFFLFNFSHTEFLWGGLNTFTMNIKIIEFLRDGLGVKNPTLYQCMEETLE